MARRTGSKAKEAERHLVEDDEALDEALDRLAESPVLTLDTEFDWERTYDPILALVQVAGVGEDGVLRGYAVDPFAVDLGPLVELLGERERTKVLHAGRIDLQIFQQAWGTFAGPAFDTQIAASLLGLGGQVGYATLVQAVTGQKLAKTEQYSDWTARPLRPAQVRYALDDVIPLWDVYRSLLEDLEGRGRLRWLAEELVGFNDPAQYEALPDAECYTKVKSQRTLDPEGRAVLRELAAWREAEGRRRNVRPGFVVKDPTLMDMARRRPKELKALGQVRGLHQGEVKKSGGAILEAIARGEAAEPVELSRRAQRAKVEVGPAVDLLKALLNLRAQEAEVASEVLAKSRDLERLAKAVARGDDLSEEKLLQGWRGELVGEDMVRLLKGELALSLDPEAMQLKTV